MNNSLQDLTKQLRVIWSKRWTALSAAAVICLVGWALVFFIPDKYEARARIYYDTQSMLRPALKGLAVDVDIRQQIAQTTRQTLLNRPNLDFVIERTDLKHEVATPADKERLMKALSEKIEIIGNGHDNIYEIAYQSPDPYLAKQVVDTLLSIFVESTLDVMRKDTNVTERFLDSQIKEYEKRLELAEQKLEEFKRKNIGLMPTESGGYFESLQRSLAQLDEARLQLREAENRRDTLRRQAKGEIPMTIPAAAGGRGPALANSPLDARIQAFQAKLDEARMTYTDEHPDVIALKETIARLEQEREQALSAPGAAESDAPVASYNPAYQEMQLALSQAEAEVSGLTVRVNEYAKRVEKLQHLVDTIPKVEAELAKLNRDYNVNKQNYESLVARRESTKISRDADQSSDSVQFNIIDPPIVPLVPISPDRPLLLTLVFVLALGGGIGLTLYMSYLKPTFHDVSDLAHVTGVPVLGSATLLRAPAQLVRARFDATIFLLSTAALALCYAAVIIASTFDIDNLGGISQMIGMGQ